ncbi:MAG TPA: hypothetical protein VLZ28_08360 [Daejeonella sp.]|nr:hypothetical protein [Daejeonella sp.]
MQTTLKISPLITLVGVFAISMLRNIGYSGLWITACWVSIAAGVIFQSIQLAKQPLAVRKRSLIILTIAALATGVLFLLQYYMLL